MNEGDYSEVAGWVGRCERRKGRIAGWCYSPRPTLRFIGQRAYWLRSSLTYFRHRCPFHVQRYSELYRMGGERVFIAVATYKLINHLSPPCAQGKSTMRPILESSPCRKGRVILIGNRLSSWACHSNPTTRAMVIEDGRVLFFL